MTGPQGAFVSNERILDELLQVKQSVAVLVDRDQREDLPRRVARLERWKAATPASIFTAVAALIFTLYQGHVIP